MCERGITMVKVIAFTIMTFMCIACTVILEKKDSDLTGLALFGTVVSFMAMIFTALIEL